MQELYENPVVTLFCGSDATNEIEAAPTSILTDLEVMKGLRFALMTKPALAAEVCTKLDSSEPVLMGTEYPATFRKYFAGQTAPIVWTGKCEGMIDYYESAGLLAVFGLVQSGQTVRDNELMIIEDGIEPVMLQSMQINAAMTSSDEKSSITVQKGVY